MADSFDLNTFLKRKRTITAGCGRGVTFRSLKEVGNFKKLDKVRKVSLTFLQEKMREFQKLTPLYHKTGGMHAACIITPTEEMIVREDIGRHNAVDKVIGAALKRGLAGKDLVLLTTGRISFEMCSKVARFGIGVAGSRTAATNLAVALGKELNVDLVGYVRGKSSFCLYQWRTYLMNGVLRSMQDATLIVLAGGKSSRMGRNKALLPVAGKTTVIRVFEALHPRFQETILVTNQPEEYAQLTDKLRIVPGHYPGLGPSLASTLVLPLPLPN